MSEPEARGPEDYERAGEFVKKCWRFLAMTDSLS
jgi:hypothetical protein